MLLLRCAALAVALAYAASGGSAFAADTLKLTDALRSALTADNAILAAEARVDAADAALLQSGKRPNPSLGVDVENFGGSGAVSGFSDTEITLSYQQRIELGGKRDSRVALAGAERTAAEARILVARLALSEGVQLAYVEALAAEASIALAKERLGIARSLQDEIAKRIASARDPEFAGARADAQVAEAQLALDQAQLRAKAAAARLASFWGGTASFRLDPRAFTDLTPPPDTGFAADVAVLEAERTASAARVDVERSKGVADPTFSVGVRHFSRNDDVALMVGGSIPLSVFDDNSASVARAAAEERATGLDLAAYRAAREREIARLRGQLAIAAAEARAIDTDIVPAAERAVGLVREGFSRGAFTYLDVTEAQNQLSSARARRIAVLRAFHADKAALDRLLGTHMAITNQEPGR